MPSSHSDEAAVGGGQTVPAGRSLTLRGVLAGLLVGLVICFSNMYFGLQTGWVSSMTMPASLMGFAIFRSLTPLLRFPFSAVENVLVQTVAGSMAIMPLGCGFVGVIPALNYLLTPEENGPLHLPLWKLIVWSLGLCYFGVIFAVPLRRQVIIKEQLKFPSGFSTAVLIGVLHGHASPKNVGPDDSYGSNMHNFASLASKDRESLLGGISGGVLAADSDEEPPAEISSAEQWKEDVRVLLACFTTSGVFTLSTYFFPGLRNVPIFGSTIAHDWLWTLNPSLAYVGQGIIMGPSTTAHMLLGALVGWAILSPVAKYNGWAPGPVDSWQNGSKGWVVWISLAIMLADAVVSLADVLLKELRGPMTTIVAEIWKRVLRKRHTRFESDSDASDRLLQGEAAGRRSSSVDILALSDLAKNDMDAPLDQLVSFRVVSVGLALSVVFCVLAIQVVFGHLVPLYATIAAVFMALILSIMGVRALGETDLNPVSGISKLTQLFFAIIIPQTNKSSVLINLIAGAVSEAGALQAGDLMQDLKTGHLLGAAPNAQFWGQIVGATVGAVTSALIYVLYTTDNANYICSPRTYPVPGDLFQVPTGYVWIFTARLVTGKGLPPMAKGWSLGFASLFAVLTIVRIRWKDKAWQAYIPGGIAFAVGMYNVPSFTLARAIGGLVAFYWRSRLKRDDVQLIVVASGFILGEGFVSIVNLLLQSFSIPHF